MRAALLGLAAAAVTFALIAAVAGIEEDGGGRQPASERPVTEARPPTDREVAQGRVLFARMGCGGCHALAAAGSRGRIGPDLAGLSGHTRESLVAAISNPPPDTIMPADFAERMTRAELEALAAFLISARDG